MSTDTAPAPDLEIQSNDLADAVAAQDAPAAEPVAAAPDEPRDFDAETDKFFADAEAEEEAAEQRERDEQGRFKAKDEAEPKAGAEKTETPATEKPVEPETPEAPARKITYKFDKDEREVDLAAMPDAEVAAVFEKAAAFDNVMPRRENAARTEGAREVLDLIQAAGVQIRHTGRNKPYTNEPEYEVILPAAATPQEPEADPLATEEARVTALEEKAVESGLASDVIEAQRARSALTRAYADGRFSAIQKEREAAEKARQEAEQAAAQKSGAEEFRQKYQAAFAPHAETWKALSGEAQKVHNARAWAIFQGEARLPGATYEKAQAAVAGYLRDVLPKPAPAKATETPTNGSPGAATPPPTPVPPVTGGGVTPTAGGGQAAPRKYTNEDDIPDSYWDNMTDE